MTEADLQRQIREWLERNRDTGVEWLRALVQARSVQREEAAAQELLADHFRRLGMEADLWEPDVAGLEGHPLFTSTRSDFRGSPNLVGRAPGTGGGRSLLINGHIDVVPVWDASGWSHDPWAGDVVDGRLYGRGASDMKAGFVSVLLALSALRDLSVTLAGDVVVESVVEEKSGGGGTLAAALRGYRADGALIPEPTGLAVFPKQQGSLWFRVSVHGRGAHGGTRYEGVSAIEKAVTVIAAIAELEAERNAAIEDPLFAGAPIPVPINVGVIQGGSWPSSVPEQVVLEGRMGVAPNEDVEDAQAALAAALEALGERDGWFGERPAELEWFGARWLPNDLDPESDLVTTLVGCLEAVSGEPAQLVAAPWGTDAGLLRTVTGIPTVVFGPGETAAAHQPNEHIRLDDMFAAAEVIALMLVRWCGRG